MAVDRIDKLHLVRDTMVAIVREAGGKMEVGAIAGALAARGMDDEDAIRWSVVTLEDFGAARVSAKGILRLTSDRLG